MDTAIIVGVIIGSVVAMVLVFAKTVLGITWTGKLGTTETSSQNGVIQEYLVNTNNSETELRSIQTTNQKSIIGEKANNFDSLINKQVSTCDNVTIGSIHTVQNGMIIITHIGSISQDKRYEIPIYYIRQNYQNNVSVDISAKDLEYYNPHVMMGKQK